MFGRWYKKKYTSAKCQLSLKLLLKDAFELCFSFTPIDGKAHYLAAQLLSTHRPEFSFPAPTARFRYEYPFMPRGIFARLVVRHATDLESANGAYLAWSRGMVLAHGQVRALIEETQLRGRKCIDIQIAAPPEQLDAAKLYLGHLRTDIEKLHKQSYDGLQPEEIVPFPDTPTAGVRYAYLLELARRGVRNFPLDGSPHDQDIHKLILSVDLNLAQGDSMKESAQPGIQVHVHTPVTVHAPVTNSQVTQVSAPSHAHAAASAQATASSQIQLELRGLTGTLEDLLELLPDNPEGEELRKRVSNLKDKLKPLEGKNPTATELEKPLRGLNRFLSEFKNTGKLAGEAIKTGSELHSILSFLAGKFNKLVELGDLQLDKLFF